jgi:nicotinate phosphoribosyltransferase
VDLYELTMVQAYWREGLAERPATFSLFVRHLPAERGCLVACGLDDALAWLEGLRFEDEDLADLEALGGFEPAFLAWLADWRFRGRVRAVPEGTPVVAQEPLLEVDASLAEGQLVESGLLNLLTTQTTLATKAARLRAAAGGRPVVDFALRRTQGFEASLRLARAAALVGLAGTSNVRGARRYGLPASGTMAHSYVLAHRDEQDAFVAYGRQYGSGAVLLVDTYDPHQGIQRAVAAARRLAEEGQVVRGLRIDSGDLGALARRARDALDAAGLRSVQVVLSGGLDEKRIAELLAAGTPVDAFGVGTALGVAEDAPVLEAVYKLVAFDGRPVGKTSQGKASLPGPKQLWRRRDGTADVLGLAEEPGPGETYEALLVTVMLEGRRTPAGLEDLAAARARFEAAWARLPEEVRAIADPATLPLRLAPGLARLVGLDPSLELDPQSALVVVDVQNDFADPRGSLFVPGGDEIVPLVNSLVDRARQAGALVVYSQDWHPPVTPHFQTAGGPWPVHCVQGTWGAAFHPGLQVAGEVLQKGAGGEDGYSAFSMRDPASQRQVPTGLAERLRAAGVRHLVVCGLALDVCVRASALDALAEGFAVTVVAGACRAVGGKEATAATLAELQAAGAEVHPDPAAGPALEAS